MTAYMQVSIINQLNPTLKVLSILKDRIDAIGGQDLVRTIGVNCKLAQLSAMNLVYLQSI